MIKGVIFDCYGVLSGGSLTHMAHLAPPESREAVYDINRSADRGYIAYDDYVQQLAEAVHISIEEVQEIFRKKHIRNEPLIGLVRSLRPKYKTALLSNVGRDAINEIFASEELEDLFDAVTLSSDVGMVKPSPEIYQITATRLGLQPEECVMVDDISRNVEGAEVVGMKGLLYSSNEQLKADLSELIEMQEDNA